MGVYLINAYNINPHPSPKLEQYLYQQAKQHGLSLAAMTWQLLTQSI